MSVSAVGTSSASFRIDAKIGHAWFARSGEKRGAVGRGGETLPALRRAELILSGQGRAIARRATRVPADAIIPVGGALGGDAATSDARADFVSRSVANDNGAYLDPRTRAVVREVVFLMIFCATLAGTYYLGRTHGFHNVIIVPDAETHRSRVV